MGGNLGGGGNPKRKKKKTHNFCREDIERMMSDKKFNSNGDPNEERTAKTSDDDEL